jgi:hypothetical protein
LCDVKGEPVGRWSLVQTRVVNEIKSDVYQLDYMKLEDVVSMFKSMQVDQ